MLLALDIGTTTGFAIGKPGAVTTGTWSFKPHRHEGGGMRYLRFLRQITEIHDLLSVDEVVYEEVRRHLGTDAAHVYGGLLGQLTAFCEERAIPYRGVPVGTIKSFATGKGNASKEAMIAAAKSWGYEPADDNEADAIALWHCQAVEKYGDAALTGAAE